MANTGVPVEMHGISLLGKNEAGSLQLGNHKQIGIMHRADELRFGQQSTHLEACVVDVSRPIAKAFGFTAITTDLKVELKIPGMQRTAEL